jgi:hypothetical protein
MNLQLVKSNDNWPTELMDHGFMNRLYTTRKVSSSDVERYLRVLVIIADQEISTIDDSGANVNYVNAKWCRQKRIKSKPIGYRAYDGRFIREYVREAKISIRIDGKVQVPKVPTIKGNRKRYFGIRPSIVEEMQSENRLDPGINKDW